MSDTLDVVTATPTTALDVAEHGVAPLPVAATPVDLPDLPVDEVATAVASLGSMMRYAEVIARSSLVPKSLTHGSGRHPEPLPMDQQVANIVIVMEYGKLLNLHPMVALSEINVMDGKPGCSGKLMRAKLREAGHKLRIHENSRHRADISIRLADDPVSENTHFTFDLNDAVRAGLCEMGSDGEARSRAKWDANKVLVWEAYTDAMLFERAMAKAIRALCPDVMMGVSYTLEELESMTLDVEPPPALRQRVWPHDYPNDTKLRDTVTAKKTLLDLLDGNKDAAAAAWEQFDGRPAHLLALGHLRQALGLAAPDGDTSTTPPLPDLEDAGPNGEAAGDMVTGNGTDTPAALPSGDAPDPDTLAVWLRTYEKLSDPALLGDEGWAEFQEWGRSGGHKSNARTATELSLVVGKAIEIYGKQHGGPHQWEPAELAQIAAAVEDLTNQGEVWKKFYDFTLSHLGVAIEPESWTSDQRDKFVPYLQIGATAKAAA